MGTTTAVITGVHAWVPDYVLTNAELASMVDTSDEWITTRTGIKERRILKGEDQGTSVIGIEAVKGLLAKTATDPAEIDLLTEASICIIPELGHSWPGVDWRIKAMGPYRTDLRASAEVLEFFRKY